MASWAKVASLNALRVTGNTKPKPITDKSNESPTPREVGNSKRSDQCTPSSHVAVPTIPIRKKHITTPPNLPVSITNESSRKKPSLTPLASPESASVQKVDSVASSTPPLVQLSREYDVYARPFVPLAWLKINLEPPVRTTIAQSRHRIDYHEYVSTFCGTHLLPNRPETTTGSEARAIGLAELTAPLYHNYFLASLHRECAAVQRENESHALYRVPLYLTGMVTEDPIWALNIPGLREDSPFLEMGDMLQLRQLWISNYGNITDVPMLVDGSESLFGQAMFLQGWTGVQYDACVYGVNRAKEFVYLKANDLGFLHDYRPVPMGVNVLFPLKQSKIDTQQRTLRFIASQLDMVDPSPMHTQQSVADGDFDDFNDVAATSNASSKATGQGKEAMQNTWIQRILFPTEAHGEMQTELRRIPHRALFDHATNYEQAHAVSSICTRDYGTLPYLISGPPGTGKTKTLVETAMQLFNTSEATHTLICAPSEVAADTLALRLKKYLSNEQLFRLIRPGRNDTEVPGELTQYCYMTYDMFSLPPIKTMMAYNIVVTSCQDAGILFDARLTNDDLWHIERNMFATFHPEDQVATPRLHWGALLIDEAAQATEIDLLAAISVACPPSSYPTDLPQPLFIMAGDENQLGPKTASRDPQFSKSLFARLRERPLYKNHPLSRSSVKPSAAPPVLKKNMLPIIYPPFTNLIRNYRSHPAILSVPSSLFYNDTLIPESPTPNTPLQTSPLWRGRKWPVLFVPNTAPDEIERDGGGWYNIAEAHIACSIAQQLIRDSGVAQKDICIMSPFAAQVKLLRSRIRSQQYGLWEVNIGPLEAFQGLEKRVVIVCTTRTRARFLAEDERRGLGIVQQKRKMNVALTRAKEALFVVGNPGILVRDECWKTWLAFCWRNGLVDDRGEGWDGDAEGFGEGNVGVLERALVAKEDSVGETGKVLGKGAEGLDMSRDYEVWMDSLREALDEESEDTDEEEEEDGEE
ncbi:hypothetical protein HBI74_130020 [Parastagonospora nodorum]|nr:hypothetical protein HBI74_130020 [Parastagonospora nodorum]